MDTRKDSSGADLWAPVIETQPVTLGPGGPGFLFVTFRQAYQRPRAACGGGLTPATLARPAALARFRVDCAVILAEYLAQGWAPLSVCFTLWATIRQECPCFLGTCEAVLWRGPARAPEGVGPFPIMPRPPAALR